MVVIINVVVTIFVIVLVVIADDDDDDDGIPSLLAVVVDGIHVQPFILLLLSVDIVLRNWIASTFAFCIIVQHDSGVIKPDNAAS